VTKNEFIKRMALRLSYEADVRMELIEQIVVSVFDEIKEVVREGDELHLNNFGRFYPKHMSERVVRGGWYQHDQKQYHVPQKTKIGFSSFPTVDRYVSQPREREWTLNEDVFSSDF
jgi:nucleoid DNA-binding protein